MWSDNETEKDFLNFSSVAISVAEIITHAEGRPTSIGISGSWGAGKSSMIKLVRSALGEKDKNDPKKYIFVEFNAWLYQGYDDARAALLEVIATKLNIEAEARKTGKDKAKELLQRVNWLRAAKLGVGSALALALGVPPVNLIKETVNLGVQVLEEIKPGENEESADPDGANLSTNSDGLLKGKPELSPPREIHAIRQCFEQTLAEMDVTLVVLIDDLDRCLPPTTISTLEAIRLFLFLENTAFVIAADDAMIKHAVRRHFDSEDDDLATNYFDKLVQIPIRVPALGTQEVRAYMMLLFIEESALDEEQREDIRQKVCSQLAESWRGKRVDSAFLSTILEEAPAQLVARFDTADRLAPLMVSASQIAGNPRLVKRFLNALSIRMAIAHAQGVDVDEAVVAKMLLFERCGNSKAYEKLTADVNNNLEGKPTLLENWERSAQSNEEFGLEQPWNEPFIREWLSLAPQLADTDLRGVLYVSREHAPVITPEDRLSSEGAELLTAILERPELAQNLTEKLEALPRTETSVIMDRLLELGRKEQVWGTPAIIDAFIAVAKADPSQGTRVAGFLSERPPSQIQPGIVPKIRDQPWSTRVFVRWKSAKVNSRVKKAIEVIQKT